MKLYHGTNKEFDRIDLLKSKPNKGLDGVFIFQLIIIKRLIWQM